MTAGGAKKHRVLVVGGGFAGMTAALQLAEQGCAVTIAEKEAAIGGHFPLLDRTFPTDSCGVCFLSPKQPAYCPFIECELRENITIKVGREVAGLTGGPGDFRAKLRTIALGVDQNSCIDCGVCVTVCPVRVPDEFSDGLEERRAIYKQYPKMVRAGYRIDFDACTRCGACLDACPVHAVNLDSEATEEELIFDAVLLAPGFSLVDGRLKGEYGFGRYPNVVSSRQLERMISFSGPSGGRVYAPADGSMPRRVAFIQCVGSRDVSCGRGYCSSVCCMYTAKQAAFIRERSPETEVVVYYIDIRGMGKGYETYLNRVRKEYQVEYRRSMVSTVKEDPRTRKLALVYDAGGKFLRDEADLVVLSLGFDAPVLDFAGDVGLDTDEYGFCRTAEFSPGVTSVPGIFAAGAFCGPKDIPETVMEATCAADALLVSLAAGAPGETAAGTGIPTPKEGNVWVEEPRIGVFLCSCSGFMEERLDYSGLLKKAGQRHRVVCTEIVDHVCTAEGIAGLRAFIGKHELNRLIIGACSVRLMERLLDKFAQDIGFNPNAFTVVNLQEQCLLPHASESGLLKAKAAALVDAAVTKVYRDLPAIGDTFAVERRALVIGGGVAGMTAALSLAARGYGVFLIEKSDKLGGRLLDAHYTLKGSSPRELAESLAAKVTEDKRIEVVAGAEVSGHSGHAGNYTTAVRTGEDVHVFRHGVMIVATGGREAATDEYLYGQDRRVVTQVELEKRIATAPESLRSVHSVVMIQCVGSREPGKREYCSRVCCTHALKNALGLKNENPGAHVTVLYRDLRAYGLYEDYYRAAREAGVLFTPYDLEAKPEVSVDGGTLRVTYDDQILRSRVSIEPDMLVLSTGIEPADNRELAAILKLPLDEYGFFAESNSKAALVDFAGEGRYHCGLASVPLHIEETLTRSRAAASRAAAVLARETIRASKYSVAVSTRLCSGCGLCVEACPYDAREIHPEDNIAIVHYDLCHGCGSCAAICPNGATQQIGFDKGQIMAMAGEIMR
ncbi:MAG: CoB--CoM heterodisulfide reductase iron-sulfur subunit A family protein [Spirochaetales bacterium]|nr:CoB--CoM heterodisulfide reductase iron-sulfur subunit A family protein [Spirochaetales bacterium]